MKCRDCGKNTRARDKKKHEERWGLCSNCYKKDKDMFKVGLRIAANR